ncbi:MAG: fumarate reductase/succinate dehydrogenase flavoprotein subunit, partial [Candidatus Zixiibacteriota bacterium]
YFARVGPKNISPEGPEFKHTEQSVSDQIEKLLSIEGKRSPDSFHRELGNIMWEYCGMARNESGLKKALERIPALREEYWQNVNVLGSNEEMNMQLERAGRVADFLEFAELMCIDALHREESCGAHFREEYQTEEGEALRNDKRFSYVAAWEFKGVGQQPELNKEPLEFEEVEPATRSYK